MTFEEIRASSANLTQNKKNEIFINSFLNWEISNTNIRRAIIITPSDTPILEFFQKEYPNTILNAGQAKAFLSLQSKRKNIIKTDAAEIATMFLNDIRNPDGYTLIFGQSETPANAYFFFIKSDVIGALKLQDIQKKNL